MKHLIYLSLLTHTCLYYACEQSLKPYISLKDTQSYIKKYQPNQVDYFDNIFLNTDRSKLKERLNNSDIKKIIYRDKSL